MRSRPITPADLTAEQRRIYDDMRPVVEADFPEIKAVRQDGALTGPWTALLQWPQYGSATWELAKALSLSPALPADVREVAILVTGTSDSRPATGPTTGCGSTDWWPIRSN